MINRTTFIYAMKKILSGSLVAVMLLTSLLGSVGAVKTDRVHAAANATLQYFEMANSVIEIQADAGTAREDLGLPSHLRALFRYAEDNMSGGISEKDNLTDTGAGDGAGADAGAEVGAGSVETPADNASSNNSTDDYTQNVTFTTDNNLTYDDAADDAADGGLTEGDSTDGDSANNGSTDGDSTDGSSTDGDSTDGSLTEGGAEDNGATDNGEVVDNAEDNNATDGSMTGNGAAGEVIDNEYAADENMASADAIAGFQQAAPKTKFNYIAPKDEEWLRDNDMLVVYTFYNSRGGVGYRVYGTYYGEDEGFYEYDGNGSITGIVLGIPVVWNGEYDGDVPGTYVLTAGFAPYGYKGEIPTAVVTVNPEEGFGMMMDAPNSFEITSGILSALAAAKVDDSFNFGDHEDWILVKKYPDTGPTTAIMLAKKGGSHMGPFGTNNTYEGSALQAFYTSYYNTWKSPLKDLVLVPNLGNNSSESARTLPLLSLDGRFTLASDTAQTKDIVFAMSRQDMVDWNGGVTTPVRKPIRDAFPRATTSAHSWSRTKGSGAQVWELNNRAEGPGYIATAANPNGNDVRVPSVLVQVAGVWRYVNVHYIDTDGKFINPPAPEQYQVLYDESLTLLENAIPEIPGYIFTEQWKHGSIGAESENAPITVKNVRKNTDIYLIYETNSEAAIVTVNYIDKATGDSIRKPDMYAATLDTPFSLNNIPTIPNYVFAEEWNQDLTSPEFLEPPVTIEYVTSEEIIYLYYIYDNTNIPIRIGVKNAYINGAVTPQNGMQSNPAHVNLNDEIKYTITTNNEKRSALSGEKYDVLFVLDWSTSMDADMVPGQSARLYEKDVMLDMSEYIFGESPESRIAVLAMNSSIGLNNNPDYTNIQYESDFLTAADYYGGGKAEIESAFNVKPEYPTEDLVSFLKAANHKMEGVKNYAYGKHLAGGSKYTIPRDGADLDERIPVIIFISDFQIPKGQGTDGSYWKSLMKNQAERFDTMHANSILQTVRFDHNGNHSSGNSDYSSSSHDNLMTAYVSPAGRPRWGFTKVDRGTQYQDALSVIKTDFENNTNPDDRATVITDVVPLGLDIDAGSISHEGVYDAATRTVVWDLIKQPEGEITVNFTVTVKQESSVFENTAGITFNDDAKMNTNTTYHSTTKSPHVDVTITKTVAGDLGDYTKAFEFTVYLIDSLGAGLNKGKQFEYTGGAIDGIDGVEAPEDGLLKLSEDGLDNAKIYLSHGQTITIKNVPANNFIIIVETEEINYNVKYKDSLRAGETDNRHTDLEPVGDADRTYDFTNTRKDIIPTGIMDGAGAQAVVSLLAILFILPGMAFVKFIKRRIYAR